MVGTETRKGGSTGTTKGVTLPVAFHWTTQKGEAPSFRD